MNNIHLYKYCLKGVFKTNFIPHSFIILMKLSGDYATQLKEVVKYFLMEIFRRQFSVSNIKLNFIAVVFTKSTYFWVGDNNYTCKDLHCSFPLKNIKVYYNKLYLKS